MPPAPSPVMVTPEMLADLRNPWKALQAFGYIIHQKNSQTELWSPWGLTRSLQEQVVNFIADAPRDQHKQRRWLNVLKPRQVGLSTVGALAFYPRTAYTPGYDHVTIADKKERAEYLHDRVTFMHNRWPEALRSPTTTRGQTRAFEFKNGSKIRTMSAKEAAAGVGASLDSLHGSEIPLWDDAGSVFSLITPAMINRDESVMLLESTPYPMSYPSSHYWKDRYMEGKRGIGRSISAFYPFWDCLLATSGWDPTWKMDLEELRLMERYHADGLTLNGLAFRRKILDNDPEFRRDPQLFQVFYPFDDITCWVESDRAIFPKAGIERLSKLPLHPWTPPFRVFKDPVPGARYVIGADPAGYAVRDHAAFHVLEVWRDEIEQVAVFADNAADPNTFADQLFQFGTRYNNALIGVESNGVGAATIALLKAKGYRNLYYEEEGKPGKVTTSKSLLEMTAWLSDEILTTLTIHDKDTVVQLGSYGHDKAAERGETAELLSPDRKGPRRERHHWDKVSALLIAMACVRRTVRRDKNPGGFRQQLGTPVSEWTPMQIEEWKKHNSLQMKRAAAGSYRLKYKSGALTWKG